ncbi:acyl-CoA/acyl-ACP dehydrogenase [Hoyosella sp. YIM 151337]|uniref:acyl-CoA dehydrogenase family protein n=1 Tax=Hoyosella sp. YIM 151337 TaxID=2992742 RepID=UPI002236B9E3|nr:acyl-CoA dehydrogenase family protein [Hoyosella sp. YIM 151337]MCW4353381.1 acyl-CoA/acyl-ACP dehydrogenase [Hoyosella sp. YIM 151337]
MDFQLDDTQREISGLTQAVLNANPEGASGEFDKELWAGLAKAGLLALANPASAGGDGLGIPELVVVLQAVARKGARIPALATLALGALPIAAFGTAQQQNSLLPEAGSGNAVLSGMLPGAAWEVTAARGGEWRLTGRTSVVPYANHAHRLVIPAETDSGQGLFLVDPGGAGVSMARVPTSSGDPEYVVQLDGVRAAPLGAQPSGESVEYLRRCATIGAVAVGCGALTGALDLTRQHLRTREQFGKPLATFQAVAQQVADVYIAARTTELALKAASWRLAQKLAADEDIALAAYWLIEHGLPAVRTCHHLHGGIGVDVTYPLHRHYSVIKDVARMLGGAEHQLEGLGV